MYCKRDRSIELGILKFFLGWYIFNSVNEYSWLWSYTTWICIVNIMVYPYDLLYGKVWFTQVDDEVPLKVLHLQKIFHSLEVNAQEASSAPDGCISPRCHQNIWEHIGNLRQLSVQIIWALGEKWRYVHNINRCEVQQPVYSPIYF